MALCIASWQCKVGITLLATLALKNWGTVSLLSLNTHEPRTSPWTLDGHMWERFLTHFVDVLSGAEDTEGRYLDILAKLMYMSWIHGKDSKRQTEQKVTILSLDTPVSLVMVTSLPTDLYTTPSDTAFIFYTLAPEYHLDIRHMVNNTIVEYQIHILPPPFPSLFSWLVS